MFDFFDLGEVQFESWGPSSSVVDLTFLALVSLSGVPALLVSPSPSSQLPLVPFPCSISLTGVDVRQGPRGDFVLA